MDSPIEELRDLFRLDWDAMDGWFKEEHSPGSRAESPTLVGR